MIVENDELPVTRQADIAFDSGADFERALEGGHTVFRDSRAMEPAVREPHWARI